MDFREAWVGKLELLLTVFWSIVWPCSCCASIACLVPSGSRLLLENDTCSILFPNCHESRRFPLDIVQFLCTKVWLWEHLCSSSISFYCHVWYRSQWTSQLRAMSHWIMLGLSPWGREKPLPVERIRVEPKWLGWQKNRMDGWDIGGFFLWG